MPRRKKSEAEVQPENGDAAVTEQVQQLPLADLHPFEDHPFKVLDDDFIAETVESIRQMGVAPSSCARIRTAAMRLSPATGGTMRQGLSSSQ